MSEEEEEEEEEEEGRRNGTYIQLPVGQASSLKKLLVGVGCFMIRILWLFGDYIEDYWKSKSGRIAK